MDESTLPSFAISVITDMWVEGFEIPITHEEVLQAAKAAEPKLKLIFNALIAVI